MKSHPAFKDLQLTVTENDTTYFTLNFSMEGACTNFFLGCFFEKSIPEESSKSNGFGNRALKRSSFSARDDESSSGKSRSSSISSKRDRSDGAASAVYSSYQLALLEDLELVLEGRGLVSTIYLPSKATSENSSSSVPRTAFIRSKHGDSKVECQVVLDNSQVANGTLKRFKFCVFDVLRVSKGRDKNSLIPSDVDNSLIMRFTILKKGELHFVFESQIVRDDIVSGFKLLFTKKKNSMKASSSTKGDEMSMDGASELDSASEKGSVNASSVTNSESKF